MVNWGGTRGKNANGALEVGQHLDYHDDDDHDHDHDENTNDNKNNDNDYNINNNDMYTIKREYIHSN